MWLFTTSYIDISTNDEDVQKKIKEKETTTEPSSTRRKPRDKKYIRKKGAQGWSIQAKLASPMKNHMTA